MTLSHITTESDLADYLQSTIGAVDNKIEQITKEAQLKIAGLHHKAEMRMKESRGYGRKQTERINLRHEARVMLAEANNIEDETFDAQIEADKERGRIIDSVGQRKMELGL